MASAAITQKEGRQAVETLERKRAVEKAKRSYLVEVLATGGGAIGREVLLQKTTLATTLPGGTKLLDAGLAGWGIYKGMKRGGGKSRDIAVGLGNVGIVHLGTEVGQMVAAQLP